MERFIPIKERGAKAMVTILSKEVLDNVLRRLMLAFQYKPTSQNEYNETFNLYYNSLKESGITEKQLLDVSGKLVFTWKPEYGRKFPTVKEFVDLAGVSAQSIAKVAHGALKIKIMKVGGYECLDLGKEHKHFVAMEAVRKMGGWFVICQKGVEEWERNKARFCTEFENLYYSGKVPKRPLLCGSDLRNTEFLENYNSKQIENYHGSCVIQNYLHMKTKFALG